MPHSDKLINVTQTSSYHIITRSYIFQPYDTECIIVSSLLDQQDLSLSLAWIQLLIIDFIDGQHEFSTYGCKQRWLCWINSDVGFMWKSPVADKTQDQVMTSRRVVSIMWSIESWVEPGLPKHSVRKSTMDKTQDQVMTTRSRLPRITVSILQSIEGRISQDSHGLSVSSGVAACVSSNPTHPPTHPQALLLLYCRPSLCTSCSGDPQALLLLYCHSSIVHWW